MYYIFIILAIDISLKPKLIIMKTNWIINPSTLQIIAVLILYSVAMLLNIMAMTDLFTASPFSSQYIMLYVMMLLATVGVIKLIGNFVRSKNS